MYNASQKLTLKTLLKASVFENEFSKESLQSIRIVFNQYYTILKNLYIREPDLYANLFVVGIVELEEHYRLIEAADSPELEMECYQDFKDYLQSAIVDAESEINSFIWKLN